MIYNHTGAVFFFLIQAFIFLPLNVKQKRNESWTVLTSAQHKIDHFTDFNENEKNANHLTYINTMVSN